MVESPAFILGLFAGLVLVALAIGLWWSTRRRSQFEALVLGAAERAQRAETLADELRRSLVADRAELDRLRSDLAEAMRARAVAETQAAETVKHVTSWPNRFRPSQVKRLSRIMKRSSASPRRRFKPCMWKRRATWPNGSRRSTSW